MTKIDLKLAQGLTLYLDINECDKKESPCHERAECFNEPGTFRCKAGFQAPKIGITWPRNCKKMF